MILTVHSARVRDNERMAKNRRRQLRDTYRFPGFVPAVEVRGIFGDPKARLVSLHHRRKKLRAVNAVAGVAATTTGGSVGCEISPVATRGCIWRWRCGGWRVRVARP